MSLQITKRSHQVDQTIQNYSNNHLNDDVLYKLFSYLHYKDVMACTLVCKTWNRNIYELGEPLWRALLKRDFPNDVRSDESSSLTNYKTFYNEKRSILGLIAMQLFPDAVDINDYSLEAPKDLANISTAVLSREEKYFFTGHASGEICVWETRGGTRKAILKNDDKLNNKKLGLTNKPGANGIQELFPGDNENELIAVYRNGNVRLWDLTNSQSKVIKHLEGYYKAVYKNGFFLYWLKGDDILRYYSSRTNETIAIETCKSISQPSVLIHKNNGFFVVQGESDKEFYLQNWDLEKNKEVWKTPLPCKIFGKSLLVKNNETLCVFSAFEVLFLDLKSGQIIHKGQTKIGFIKEIYDYNKTTVLFKMDRGVGYLYNIETDELEPFFQDRFKDNFFYSKKTKHIVFANTKQLTFLPLKPFMESFSSEKYNFDSGQKFGALVNRINKLSDSFRKRFNELTNQNEALYYKSQKDLRWSSLNVQLAIKQFADGNIKEEWEAAYSQCDQNTKEVLKKLIDTDSLSEMNEIILGLKEDNYEIVKNTPSDIKTVWFVSKIIGYIWGRIYKQFCGVL